MKVRITVHIPDDIAQMAEEVAKEAGIPVSALYAEAIEAHVKALRWKQAIEAINSLIGKTYIAPDFDEQLEEMRRDDPERL